MESRQERAATGPTRAYAPVVRWIAIPTSMALSSARLLKSSDGFHAVGGPCWDRLALLHHGTDHLPDEFR